MNTIDGVRPVDVMKALYLAKAKDLGMLDAFRSYSPTKIIDSLEELRRAGLLKVVWRNGKKGGATFELYSPQGKLVRSI